MSNNISLSKYFKNILFNIHEILSLWLIFFPVLKHASNHLYKKKKITVGKKKDPNDSI